MREMTSLASPSSRAMRWIPASGSSGQVRISCAPSCRTARSSSGPSNFRRESKERTSSTLITPARKSTQTEYRERLAPSQSATGKEVATNTVKKRTWVRGFGERARASPVAATAAQQPPAIRPKRVGSGRTSAKKVLSSRRLVQKSRTHTV